MQISSKFLFVSFCLTVTATRVWASDWSECSDAREGSQTAIEQRLLATIQHNHDSDNREVALRLLHTLLTPTPNDIDAQAVAACIRRSQGDSSAPEFAFIGCGLYGNNLSLFIERRGLSVPRDSILCPSGSTPAVVLNNTSTMMPGNIDFDLHFGTCQTSSTSMATSQVTPLRSVHLETQSIRRDFSTNTNVYAAPETVGIKVHRRVGDNSVILDIDRTMSSFESLGERRIRIRFEAYRLDTMFAVQGANLVMGPTTLAGEDVSTIDIIEANGSARRVFDRTGPSAADSVGWLGETFSGERAVTIWPQLPASCARIMHGT